MAPSAETDWSVQSKDAKRALAEDKYDDCTSCRVTGMFTSGPGSLTMIDIRLTRRQDPLRLSVLECTVTGRE